MVLSVCFYCRLCQVRIQELEFLNAAVAAVSSQDGGEKSAASPSAAGGLHDQVKYRIVCVKPSPGTAWRLSCGRLYIASFPVVCDGRYSWVPGRSLHCRGMVVEARQLKDGPVDVNGRGRSGKRWYRKGAVR